jgi:hypothetical protein
MSSSAGFAADGSPDLPLSRDTFADGTPPSRRILDDAWSPLVVATIWWGLLVYASVRALLAG